MCTDSGGGPPVTDVLDSNLVRAVTVGPGDRSAGRFDPSGVTWTGGGRFGDGGSLLWFRGREDAGTGVYVADLEDGRVDRVGPDRLWPVAPAGRRGFAVTEQTLYRATPGPALAPVGRLATGDGRVTAGPAVAADGERVLAVVAGDGDRRVVAWSPDELVTWVDGPDAAVCRPNPTDPTLALLVGPADEPRGRRAWLCRAGLGARPIHDALPTAHRSHRWAADGTGLWYVAPGRGVEHLDLAGWSRDTVWSVDARDVAPSRDGGLLAVTTAGAESVVRVRARAASASVSVGAAGTGPLRFPHGLDALVVGTADGLTVVPERSLRDVRDEEK